jgi:hypothetical protein
MDTRFVPWTPANLDAQVLEAAALTEAKEKHKKQLMARPYLATSHGGRDQLGVKRRRDLETARTRFWEAFNVVNVDKELEAKAGLVKALFNLQVARNLAMLASELIDAENARSYLEHRKREAARNADPAVQAAAEQLFREAVKLRERDELEGWLIICFGLAVVVTLLFVFAM